MAAPLQQEIDGLWETIPDRWRLWYLLAAAATSTDDADLAPLIPRVQQVLSDLTWEPRVGESTSQSIWSVLVETKGAECLELTLSELEGPKTTLQSTQSTSFLAKVAGFMVGLALTKVPSEVSFSQRIVRPDGSHEEQEWRGPALVYPIKEYFDSKRRLRE